MAKKKGQTDRVEDIEVALTKTEQYIEDNQKSIMIIVGAVIVIVLAFLAVRNFYIKPKEREAANQMYVAEQYFEKDSFNLALYGDGNNFGFLVIEDRGWKKQCYYRKEILLEACKGILF